MNDVNNRIFREFTEFFDNVEKSASEISVTMAYEITMKSTISTAIIVLESEGRLEERYWNHLRVQNNILDFLYDLWVGSCHSLASEFSTIMKDLVEYDFIITESIMRERMQVHEKIDFNFEPVQRRLAPLPQMRYYWHGCRGYSWSKSLPLGISGVPR